MKALLIADDELAITNISQVLETAGYDVIVYKWLLKALDNIEEIAPHLIVVSTKDYPRHWKTLTQFAATAFSGYRPEVVLYTDGSLDEDELRKAQALKVRGWFESVDVEGLDKLRQILTKEIDIYSGKLVDEEGKPHQDDIAEFALRPPYSDDTEEEIIEDDNHGVIYCSYMFTNPLTGILVSGSTKNFNGQTFEFEPDIMDLTKNLSVGTKINIGTLKIQDSIKHAPAVVKSNSQTLLLELFQSA